MSASGLTFALLDGRQAADHTADLQALRSEACGGAAAPGLPDRQFRVRHRQPGFVLAEARHGGYLVGYASGLPLRPSTSWWKDLTSPLPADVTTEYPGRTFALTELLVRPAWRRQGIATSLHGLVLSGRPEERATLTLPPGATPAQRALRGWGWRKIARTRAGEPGAPALDVLVTTLPL